MCYIALFLLMFSGRSEAVSRLSGGQETAGSTPVVPTIFKAFELFGVRILIFGKIVNQFFNSQYS